LLAAETEEKSFLDYFDVLRRKKFLVIAIVVVFILAAFGLDFARSKVYSATASMQLVSQNIQQNGGTVDLTSTDVSTDIELVQSAAVKEIVATDLHQPAPEPTVTEVGLTDVLDVKVSSTDNGFAVKAANDYVNAYVRYTTQRYAQQTEQQETALHTQQSALQNDIKNVEDEISDGGSKGATNTALNTELQVYAAQLEEVNTSLSQLELDQTQVSAGALLINPALASKSSISPHKLIDAALAGVLGLLIGIGAAVLMDFLDDRIRTKEQLHTITGRLPLLGEIPEFDNWKEKSEIAIIAADRPKSPAAEAYRSLRTAIQFIGFDSERTNVIQITSPMENEGKTTTVVDLAVTMASSGTRVAVVSCDLRRPGIHKYFKVLNFFGLSSLLSGTETEESVTVVSEEFPNLVCIPSGPVPPNPSELLGSPRLAELFESLRNTYDVVLVDSPPVLPVTDALVVAQSVDCVVLLARAGQSHARAVSRGLELLAGVDAPVKGVVLNAVALERSRGGYGYGRYGRYGGYSTYGGYTTQP
jgi:succinoglycan biosynthesis transport protein ExoP